MIDRIERIYIIEFRQPADGKKTAQKDIVARGGNLQPGLNKGMHNYHLYNQINNQFRRVFAESIEDACKKLDWKFVDVRRVGVTRRGKKADRLEAPVEKTV